MKTITNRTTLLSLYSESGIRTQVLHPDRPNQLCDFEFQIEPWFGVVLIYFQLEFIGGNYGTAINT